MTAPEHPGDEASLRAGFVGSPGPGGSLTAEGVSSWMGAFATSLGRHRDSINRLNVYPVPDGDTGTNLQLTMDVVRRELADLGEGATLSQVATAMAHGSLMGARGNSGVILCHVLRGIAGVCRDRDSLDAAALAAGLVEAHAQARSGITRPVEGTMLTVAADAAAAAAERAEAGGGVLEVAEGAFEESVRSLARTPELLPVLARAGVVDAGGAGLVLMLDALVTSISGRELLESLPLPPAVRQVLEQGGRREGAGFEEAAGAGPAGEAGAGEPAVSGVGDLRYEVMYLLDAVDESIGPFKQVWAGIGDSIVIVGGDGLWNCHIHTDDIGAAIEAGIDAGRPRRIRVTDLLDQVEEEAWVRRAESEEKAGSAGSAGGAELVEGPPVTSAVAVATGEGIGRIFHSLGVRHVVAGGQSMNPSTAEILEVVEATPGREVVVLPNNKNIFATAAKAGEIASKPVRIVPTEGIQEGFAALLEYDPEADAASNAAAMSAAAARVVAGEVTQAIRASETTAGSVEAGDFIGLSRHGIEVVAPTAGEAACALLDKLLTDSHEIVTIIEGAGATPADTRRITEWLGEAHPSVSVDHHHGGQPLYSYLVSAE